jgi:hypothetical protein
MATRLFFPSIDTAAFRLSLASLSRTLQIWSGELSRALVATHRYELLRISSGTGVLHRASKARQIFAELYGGRRSRRAPSKGRHDDRPKWN